MIRALLVGMFFVGSGCPHPTPPPVPPTPSEPASCTTACVNMQTLGCEAGRPTLRGEPCVAVCENVMTSDIITWDLKCMTNATSCAAVDSCNP